MQPPRHRERREQTPREEEISFSASVSVSRRLGGCISGPYQLVAEIKQRAKKIGFDLVGIAPAQSSSYKKYFRDWLTNGSAGEMQYLHRRFDERVDPVTYLPGANSVICVAMNYHLPVDSISSQQGRIAQYALGDDYHDLLKSRLFSLAAFVGILYGTMKIIALLSHLTRGEVSSIALVSIWADTSSPLEAARAILTPS